MPKWEWLVLVTGLVAAFWRQATSFVDWLKGWVVVTRKTDYTTGLLLMLSFMDATMRRQRSRYQLSVSEWCGCAHALGARMRIAFDRVEQCGLLRPVYG